MIKVTYHIYPAEGESLEQKVESVCLEQSVELPRRVLPSHIAREVVGEPLDSEALEEGGHRVTIGWNPELTGGDLSQFLNTLYGNISLQAGIRVTGVDWHSLPEGLCGGPAFGIGALRETWGIPDRALCATSLKPAGSTAEELGELCREFAAGGLDLMKDDHGVTNQHWAPFAERVRRCVEGVRRAEQETGRRAFYFAHVTARADRCVARYRRAAELGADGALVCPHIAGMETMHQLARMDLPLPVIAHPAFSGGLTTHPRQGLTPELLYGQLWRALGADLVVYPNTGGRFSFSLAECEAINRAARRDDLPFPSAFPMPGGGMRRENIPQWVETYGPDTVFLLGTSLYEHPGGVREAARELSAMLKESP